MARKELINTFLKLDTDTSQNKQDNTSFYDGQNLRLVSDEALTNGALVNYKGTKAKIDLGSSFLKLKGYAEVGSDLALLLHKDADSLVPDVVNAIPDRYLKNYTAVAGTSYNNYRNYESVSDITSGNSSSNVSYIGTILKYYTETTNPLFNLYTGKSYKFEIYISNVSTYTLEKACFMIIKNPTIVGEKTSTAIPAADVVYHKNINTFNVIDDTIEFELPLTSDNYYAVIYPGYMNLEGDNYIYDDSINSVSMSILSISYKNSPEDPYIELDAAYKALYSPTMTAYQHANIDTNATAFILPYYEFTPDVNDGITAGYKYRITINQISTLNKTATVYVYNDDEIVHESILYSNAATLLPIDITNSTSPNQFKIRVRVSDINDSISVYSTSINRIYKHKLLHTINSNNQQVYQFKLQNISTDNYVDIVIKNGNTIVKKIPFYIQNSVGVINFIPYSDYNGYTINIDMSPETSSEKEVSITDVAINTLTVSNVEILSTAFTNDRYYIFKTSIITAIGCPHIDSIKYKVINTSNNDVLYSKIIYTSISSDFRFFIPNDGNTYKLVAEVWKDDSTLINIETYGTDLNTYILKKNNYIGSLIAKVSVSEDSSVQPITIVYSDQFSLNKLNFDKIDEVQCVGKYENDSSKKIYFAVPGEPIRTFNIARNTVSTVDVEALDIIPNNIVDSIVVDSIINGGNLENGKIQYACKLFNKYGTETTFSPPTELVSLTDSTANGEDEFKGGELEQSSGKSVKIIINVENVSDFNYVKIYSIHYKTVGTPVISLVGEQQLINTSITFIDSGIILEQVTLEEYNAFGGRLVSAEALAERNNILFAANIQESIETIAPEELDCRAYRFKDEGGLGSYQSIIYEKDSDTHPSYYIIDSNGDATFYQYNGSTYVQEGDSMIDYNIPITADAINKYNNEFEKASGDVNHPYQYDLTADGLNIGGTGKIVSYIIKPTEGVQVTSDLHVKIDNTNINAILKSKSLKQGEVYRFGLVPYDNKGKPFFVNWIGDIRIPYFNGSDNIFSGVWDNEDTDNIVTTLKNIQIVFTINTSAISTDVLNKISGFQLVQVERTDIDKSVVAQGYTYSGALYSTFLNGYGMAAYPREIAIADNNTSERKNNYQYIHYLISPEFNLNKGKSLNSGNYRLRVNKILIVRNKVNSTGGVVSINSALSAPKSAIIPILTSNVSLVNFDMESITVDTITVNRGVSFDIEDFKKLSVSKETTSGVVLTANGNPVTIFNRVISDSYNRSLGFNNECTMFGQSCIVFTSSQPLPVRNFIAGAGIADAWVYQLDLYQDNNNIRYGGDTYEARMLNTYITASDFIKKDVNALITWGDMYNTIFDTLIAAGDPKSSNYTDNANQITGLFPIESSANCFLTGSKPSKYYDKYPTTSNFTYLQETQLQGVELFADKYPSIGDLNRYNTVYSANPKYPIYVVRPALFEENIVEKYSIINSQKKTVGEFIDSWAKFLYANTLEVSGKYGPIHGLTDYNNKLVFLQEDAIGVASVNERYLIGQDASQLTIGTGGVLERYDYMKYNTGVIKPTHFINTETDIFYIDSRRKVIDSLADNPLPLSILKGINSLFRGLYKDSTTFIAMGFDPLYKEVLITINNGLSNKTLVFNSMIGEFTPMQSTTPELYLSLNNELMSFLYSNHEKITRKNYVYRHNAGRFGETYSEAGYSEEVPNIYPSYISFIVNTKSPKVSIFDNIEFNTEVRKPSDDYTVGPFNDTEYVKETIDSIQFRNSYQNETRTVYPKDGNSTTPVPNVSRLIRRWSMAIPFATDKKVISGVNFINTSRRFVDTFLSIKMQYNNRDGKLFKLHDVITYIREANN